MAGRPSLYSEEIISSICEQIASGKSLVSICKQDGMPGYSTVMEWLEDKKDFADKYARARDSQADYLAEEIIELADDKLADPQRSRLQVDTRKWYAGKLKPKKYGDKLDHEHGGKLIVEIKRFSDAATKPGDEGA